MPVVVENLEGRYLSIFTHDPISSMGDFVTILFDGNADVFYHETLEEAQHHAEVEEGWEYSYVIDGSNQFTPLNSYKHNINERSFD